MDKDVLLRVTSSQVVVNYCFCPFFFYFFTFLQSSVHYYCFEGYYHCMHVAASEGVRLFPSDFKYSFYKAISFAFEGIYN